MRSAIYRASGDAGVIEIVDRPLPEPGAGDVRVAMHVAGVNPTDWKSRQGLSPTAVDQGGEQVPGQDGAGIIDAVGAGVDASRIGERVWVWEAAWGRAGGSAAEAVVVPAEQAVTLPDSASFDLGACLGIPALTAHRCLTVAESSPAHLGPGTLAGRTVLVAGGAGAVGHAAIELACWAGAHVIATVSTEAKADLARAAGAHAVINYRGDDPAAAIREHAPAGIDVIVEVSPGVNADLDAAVIAPHGTIACYATDGSPTMTAPIRPLMVANVRYQFVFVYGVLGPAKAAAVADVAAAVAAGALGAGVERGLPLTRFPLAQTAGAHRAVETGTVGKVLIDVVAT